MRKGFTLVELSIVLVIIGLFVGGILVGQSLIDSVKIQGYVRKLQQYEVAINTFTSKFKKAPGWSNSFTPSKWTVYPGVCNGVYSSAIPYQAWAHISQAQVMQGSYIAYSPSSCGGTQGEEWFNEAADVNAPTFAEESAYATSYYGQSSFGRSTKKVPPYFYTNEQGGNLQFSLYLKPASSVALDTKLDDGLSYTGNLVGSVVEYGDIACEEFVAQGVNDSTYLCYFSWYPNGR